MDIRSILEQAVKNNASDVFLIAGLPVTQKINGKLCNTDGTDDILMPAETEALVQGMCLLANGRDMERMQVTGDDDFSFTIPNLSRFRVNVYRQRGSLAAVVRVVQFDLPEPSSIGIPEAVLQLGMLNKGLVLVTGPAGSGKSTTLACMVDRINRNMERHIITLEDPIEFLHRHKKSIVSQREVCMDTKDYVTALRASLRQAPDVILLGEMRDYETIGVAMTAAETGHLVISTLHTIGAANTIDRIIDVFPANQQRQIAVQLSMTLQAAVSQQLVLSEDGTLVPAFEVMTVNPAIRNMIRDNKVPQIDGVLYSSNRPEMVSMDQALLALFREGRISREKALQFASSPEALSKKLN